MAAVHHEVSATDLEAYRAAGSVTYELLDAVGAGFDPAAADDGRRLQVLCGWVAFALQSAGDSLLEADYEADPHTVGYVPDVTRRQALAFYEEVADWSSAAHELTANPAYRPRLALLLTGWPRWVEVEPCPRPHLTAMVATAERLGERVLLMVDPGRIGAVYGQAAPAITQLLARGDARRDRAKGLWQYGPAPAEAHENIEDEVKVAIAAYFLAGQLIAMPSLSDGLDLDAVIQPAAAVGMSRPGDTGFDPWCLTDRVSLERWKKDRAARQAIDMLWAYDPDPGRTVQIQTEINAAVASGDVAAGSFGNYFCCPWSSIYQVVNPVTLGGKRLRRGQQFTFDVSAEDMSEGGPFKREILVSQFVPSSEVDYCNPEEGHHDA